MSESSPITAPRPTPGRVVWYQTDGRNFDYYVPAFVVITLENLVIEAVEQGLIEPLDSPWHVHLWTPGGKDPYHEYNVPFLNLNPNAASVEDYLRSPIEEDRARVRRTWRWPERA